jgi:hypothetical protein
VMCAKTQARIWIFLLLALTSFRTGAQRTAPLPPTQADGQWHDVSIDEYRQHLVALSALIDTCAKARNVKSCDPVLIGDDDRVPITVASQTERRLVRYGWLRMLFAKSEEPDEKAAPAIKPSAGPAKSNQEQRTISEFLADAKVRLENDLAQSHAAEPPLPDHAAERASMEEVLAGPDFRNLKRQSVTDSVWEKFANWLNRLLASAGNFGVRSAWVGRALVWGFIIAVCIVLVYSLVRLERRWRVKLTPDFDLPAPGAASARDWQSWLEDARSAAAEGMWREAIHFIYWAAISRLESRRLWPADRARTPREYLALVDPQDPRRSGLSQLTGVFERFWYGGRHAGESDYKHAENLASKLIAGGSPANSSVLSTASDGGAQ